MIVVATTEAEGAAVAELMTAHGVGGIEVLAAGGARRLVLGAPTDPWQAERVVRALRGDGWIAVDRPDGGPQLDRWRHDTRPVVIGERLSICRAWSEHDRDERCGLIELGLGGFGDGTHPTTRLLLDQLAARIAGGERVLDVGCGSGVLGLAALRLGAAELVGVDRQPQAVEATRRNAALNRLDARVRATGTPPGDLAGAFDVVLANVARAAIVELAPDLVRRVAAGGWLAVSGVSPVQCDQVAAFLRPLIEVERCARGDWAAMVLTPG